MSKTLKIVGISLIAVVLVAAASFAGITLASAQQQPAQQAALQQAPLVSAAGATVQDDQALLAAAPAEKGVVVVSVSAGGAAEKAGVKRGDILLKVNDTETNTPADVRTAIKDAKIGDPVVLSVTHGDEAKTLTATLADVNGKPALGLVVWGSGIEKLEQGGKPGRTFQMPAGQVGALISAVTDGSPAAQAGLQKGDLITAVNGKDLAAGDDLAAAIQANKPGDKITLKVTSGSTSKDVSVTLGDKDGKAYLGVQYSSLSASAGLDLLPPDGSGQMPSLPGLPNGGKGFGRGGGSFGFPAGMNGIVLVEVQKDSPAEKAGLAANDIVTALDGKAFNLAADFSAAIAAHKVGDTVTLSVTHSDKTTAEVKVTLAENPAAAGKPYLGVKIIGLGEMHQQMNPGQALPTPAAPGVNG